MNSEDIENEEILRKFEWEFNFRGYHNEVRVIEIHLVYSLLIAFLLINAFGIGRVWLFSLGVLSLLIFLVLIAKRVVLGIYGKGKYY